MVSLHEAVEITIDGFYLLNMSSEYERKLLNILEEDYGWTAVRAAGSMGKGDIIAIKSDHENSPIIIEVKKSKREPYLTTVTEDTKEQYKMMADHAERGINAVYAVRFLRGESETQWQIYDIDEDTKEYPIRRRGDGMGLGEVF